MDTPTKLPAILSDPWLQPVTTDIIDRQNRFYQKLAELEGYASGLLNFAGQYKYLGINFDSQKNGWYYREWAPKANAIFIFGDFNNWNRKTHPLISTQNGIWEIFFDYNTYKDTFIHGSLFKIWVNGFDNVWREHIPAYITRVVQNEITKDFAAQLWIAENNFDWENDAFVFNNNQPLLIYECHVGMAQEFEGVGTYNQFTQNVLPHVKNMGYNAIQIMAIAEHPYYGSFGYHVSNFFAPSSRFGTPDDLRNLIKQAHKMGIAVIMDLVHSHTVKNINEGLNLMDGSLDQYFHPGLRGEHPSWDSKLFDYGKNEVIQFLLSNIRYWLEEFRFDGFRFDGVTSMLYFHHGYTDTYDQLKYFRDGVEFDAITYLQLANTLVKKINPDAITIAEDVSGMPGMTTPVEDGGIGFDFRLGMGLPDFWIKLLKEYKDEQWDIYEMWQVVNDRLPHVKTIAYCESHDQALVGDKTIAFRLMDKEMYFDMAKSRSNLVIDRGIALHKIIRLFTIVNGGQAYMNFMGNEFGHPEWIDFPREGNGWSYKHARRLWSLMKQDSLKYHYLSDFDKQMIELIKQYNVTNDLYGRQLNMDAGNKTIVMQKGGLIFTFNFHATNAVPDYEFYVPDPGVYKIILNSDDVELGGFGRVDNNQEYYALPKEDHYILKIYNTNRTALVLKKIRD